MNEFPSPWPKSQDPHELSDEECRDIFMRHMWRLVDFWANESREPDVREKLAGLLHSILVTIDGCSAVLPALHVFVDPHESDEEFHKERSEDWFPSNDQMLFNPKGRITCSMLHEIMFQYDPKRKK